MNALIEPIYDLLKDPEHWTRYEFAKDASKIGVEATSCDATCWCLVGAVKKVYLFNDTQKYRQVRSLFDDRCARLDIFSTTTFNDSPTTAHKDILEFLKSIPE